MNFFEHLLGLSPDGGNGSLELAFLLFNFVVAALMALKAVVRNRATARN
jgi:hypothetical protein